MSKFGWRYPAGAGNDPFAPYNNTVGEDPTDANGSTATICMGLAHGTSAIVRASSLSEFRLDQLSKASMLTAKP